MPASEALQPIFGCSRLDVTEAVRKRRRSSLQLSKNSFDSVPISVATSLKSEISSLECCLEVLSAVDEKDGGFAIVFLLAFAENYLGEGGRSC